MNAAVERQVTTYHERKIGRTIYRVTSVFKGDFHLSEALEELTVRKILQMENPALKT